MATTSSVCAVVGLLMAAVTLASSAEIEPKEPLVATGDNLTVTCHVDEVDISINTVYFKYGGVPVSSELTRTLDSRTIELVMPDMQRNKTVLECLSHTRIETLDSVAVTVADRPVKPNITGCRVYNWENMTCWYEPAEQDTGIPTTQKLFWTLVPNSQKHWKLCNDTSSGGSPGSCTFSTTQLGSAVEHYLVVGATNALDGRKTVYSNTSSENPSIQVEPNAVGRLHATATSSTEAVVTWKEPKEDEHVLYQVVYQVVYQAEWLESSPLALNESKKKTTNLTNLIPYTPYTISVTCIPLVDGEAKGFWSQPANTSFQTLEDVPGAVPAVTAGSFQTLDPSRRKIRFLWKSIPRPLQHGRILGYQVQSRMISPGAEPRGSDVGNVRSFDLQLEHSNFSYEVSVVAKTKDGFNDDLVPQVVLVGPSGMVPNLPEEVAAQGNHSEIILTWTSVPGAESYTVFWCRGSTHDNTCTGDIQWTNTSDSDHTISLQADDSYTGYIVAVSAEWSRSGQVYSSGMVWADCVHDIDEEVRVPTNVKESKLQPPGGFSVEWGMPRCSSTAYISSFQVAYCTGSQCDDQDKYTYLSVHRDKRSQTVLGLQTSATYEIWLRSVGLDNQTSPFSEPVSQTVTQSGLSKGAIAGIVVASIVLFAFIVLGLYTIIKTCRERNKILRRMNPMDIKRPPPLELNMTNLEGPDYYDNGQQPANDSMYHPSHDTSTNHRLSENIQNALAETGSQYQNETATSTWDPKKKQALTNGTGSSASQPQDEQQLLQPSAAADRNLSPANQSPRQQDRAAASGGDSENVGLLTEEPAAAGEDTGRQSSKLYVNESGPAGSDLTRA